MKIKVLHGANPDEVVKGILHGFRIGFHTDDCIIEYGGGDTGRFTDRIGKTVAIRAHEPFAIQRIGCEETIDPTFHQHFALITAQFFYVHVSLQES